MKKNSGMAFMPADPAIAQARWNIWLVKCDEPPLLYFAHLSEEEAQGWLKACADKAFDGSDADGFILIRSDYPVPALWPAKVRP